METIFVRDTDNWRLTITSASRGLYGNKLSVGTFIEIFVKKNPYLLESEQWLPGKDKVQISLTFTLDDNRQLTEYSRIAVNYLSNGIQEGQSVPLELNGLPQDTLVNCIKRTSYYDMPHIADKVYDILENCDIQSVLRQHIQESFEKYTQ